MPAVAQMGNFTKLSPILVTVWQGVEKVFYGTDVKLEKFFSNTRTDPLESCYGGGQNTSRLGDGRLGHFPYPC